MNTKETIIAQIKEMSSDEILELNNLLCEQLNHPGDIIYNNDDEFFNIFFRKNTIKAINAINNGKYSYSHNYVIFNGYGNLVTFNHLNYENLYDSLHVISSHIIENFDIYKHLFTDIEIKNK